MRWNGRSLVSRLVVLGAAMGLFGSLIPLVVASADTPGRSPAGAVVGARDTDDRGGGGLSKLQHLVVMMQENRSYDSYFGYLPAFGQNGATLEPHFGNPDPTAPVLSVQPFHQTATCTTADLAHGWTAVHQEIDGGRMDGFTAANVDPTDPTGSQSMGYYTPRELPFYYALANDFGIGDRYFASVPGPTFPNRYYLLAGTSFGHIDNTLPPAGGWTQKTVFEELDAAHVSWKVYYAQVPFAALFSYVQQHQAGHLEPISQYYTDAAAGTLPSVSFIDPIFAGKVNVETDEHPPANVQVGEQFTAGVVKALAASPNWRSSALFLTYDEHGGFYDHVAPPRAPIPDDIAPMLGAGDTEAQFDQYGVRVPAIVISPYSRPHFVSNRVHDHTSILATIEDRFGLASLTRRDAQANPMTEFFDFSHRTYAQPPTLPAASVDSTAAAQCSALHP